MMVEESLEWIAALATRVSLSQGLHRRFLLPNNTVRIYLMRKRWQVEHTLS